MLQATGGGLNDRNLNSISKIDPFVSEILDQSGHVALYEFDVDSKNWKRKEVAGPFFVYKRKAKPYYSFLIANRHSPDDLIQPILPSILFELKEPFVFVNLPDSEYPSRILKIPYSEKIIGLWFSANEEAKKIHGQLESLLKNLWRVDICCLHRLTDSNGYYNIFILPDLPLNLTEIKQLHRCVYTNNRS